MGQMNLENKEAIYKEARVQAWTVLERSMVPGSGLKAAAKSTLYPHVWARDACIASLGILSARRGRKDLDTVLDSLGTLARHQTELGRMPLKVDPVEDQVVAENSAGVDSGLWFVIVVDALRQIAGDEVAAPFTQAALNALHWSLHLDVNGCGLLESPEASDWADMLPNRHNVLGTNVLFYSALCAGSRIATTQGDRALSKSIKRRAREVQKKVNLLFWPQACTDAAGTGKWLEELEAEYPEWSRTGAVIAPRGSLSYYLPYIGFRCAGSYCDIPGNALAILTGLAPEDRAHSILDHMNQTGCAAPYPSKAIDPPILPGDPDWRDYFLWRDLNRPHRYQNGGIWPFIGSFHIAALVQMERYDEALQLLDRLVEACYDHGKWTFPEWMHAQSGQAMGERQQAWSASGLLFAMTAVEQRTVAPCFSPLNDP